MIKTKEVLKIIRHKYPFFFVDKILSFRKNEEIIGFKNFTFNEYFFRGHFPNDPVVPGVIITEALAQTCAIFASLNRGEAGEVTPIESLMCAVSIRFKQVVEPGDSILLCVSYDWKKETACCFNVKAIDRESNKIVAIGTIKSKIRL